MGASIELNPDPAVEPLKHGPSGWLIRVGGVLSGPYSARSAYDQLIFKRQPVGEVAQVRGNFVRGRIGDYAGGMDSCGTRFRTREQPA